MNVTDTVLFFLSRQLNCNLFYCDVLSHTSSVMRLYTQQILVDLGLSTQNHGHSNTHAHTHTNAVVNFQFKLDWGSALCPRAS